MTEKTDRIGNIIADDLPRIASLHSAKARHEDVETDSHVVAVIHTISRACGLK